MEVEEGELVPVFDRRYHASGHAPVEDLLAMVDGIGAGKIVPVHTEDPRPFLHAKEGEVVVPRPGQPIDL
jgi:mRNA degradation ribonuclease J1/J2